MAIKAIVFWDESVITSISDASLGLNTNRHNREVLADYVREAISAVQKIAEKYAERYTTSLAESHPSYITTTVLCDGQPHMVASGMGKTYVRYDPEQDMWLVWRNNDPPLLYRSLYDAAKEGVCHLTTKKEVENSLKTTLIREALRELKELVEGR